MQAITLKRAKQMIKDELKRQDIRLSLIDAEEITKAAKELVANQPKSATTMEDGQ